MYFCLHLKFATMLLTFLMTYNQAFTWWGSPFSLALS